MTRIHAILAVTACMLMLGSLLAGRASAPTKTIEHTRTVEVAAKSTTTAATAESSKRTDDVRLDGAVVTHWRTRTIPGPGCAQVATETDGERIEHTREAEHATGAATRATAATATVEVRYVDREKLVLREAAKVQWSAGVSAGLSLDAQRIFGGTIERRIAGPLWGGLYVETNKTAGIRARLEW